MAAINITSALLFFKETHTEREAHTHIKLNIIHIFRDVFVGKERMYYLIYFLINLGIMTYQSIFLLYLNKEFNITGNIG
ncbi:TPA: hypothetical protein DEP21_06010 [Patescibacteria group bacterium]|nr:hypothetical protein [Candidatus Gracilibacteria bacterium]